MRAWFLIALLSWSVPAWAGSGGVLKGLVTSERLGLPASGVRVIISGERVVGERTRVDSVRTKSDGSFTFDQLGPGLYTLSAEGDGFGGVTIEDVVVRDGSTCTEHLVLPEPAPLAPFPTS